MSFQLISRELRRILRLYFLLSFPAVSLRYEVEDEDDEFEPPYLSTYLPTIPTHDFPSYFLFLISVCQVRVSGHVSRVVSVELRCVGLDRQDPFHSIPYLPIISRICIAYHNDCLWFDG